MTGEDGRVISSSHDKTVKVWDVGSAEEHRKRQRSQEASGSQRLLAVDEGNDTQSVGDVSGSDSRPPSRQAMSSGRERSGSPATSRGDDVHRVAVKDRKLKRRSSALRMVQDDRTVIQPHWGNTIKKPTAPLGSHSDRVTCAAVSLVSDRAATGSADTEVKVWHLQSGKELAVILGHQKAVTAVHWAPNDELLFSGDANGLIMVRRTCACKLGGRHWAA